MTFALSSPVYFDPRSGLWRCASLDPPWPEKGGGGRGDPELHRVVGVVDGFRRKRRR